MWRTSGSCNDLGWNFSYGHYFCVAIKFEKQKIYDGCGAGGGYDCALLFFLLLTVSLATDSPVSSITIKLWLPPFFALAFISLGFNV